ncbi:permease [Clostridium pasteurianum DSM 525 = ATCC 6013]|uniref:Major facilitator superfamily MFS_1 n=1 Tax=Clostridium pasteurianum DSM 525 = ATCC 6013 TaxID=1262449 RepID=A0A0H3J2F4_CLOPA|nr:MFS transporter [Clostridium pasteurianum]AJA47614.1 permease [Clostridium pasteurianum DSM 525 = ATCC 6013]AJA51602.1 permease [Clostridium pasteurianum DSM 525 = ATCC 6013]AOZ74926.1 MFS transporter [Clostridium pasteurianum DSM 525 = ATCC 6013]AOZ78721.1 MFS transporter [Clostridium pasteurianum]ELP58046.1 permease [Clostridium pasteurianum DSM 525 = ATCC 6013]
MNKDFRNMIIIFIGFFFLALFSNTVSPFITTIKNMYNVSEQIIAILPPLILGASFMMSIAGGKIINVLGVKKGLYLGFFFMIASSIILLISKNFYVLLIGYFVSGLSIGMCTLSLTTTLSLLPEKYQKFSLSNAFVGLGGILILPIDRFILSKGILFNYTYIIHIVSAFIFFILITQVKGIVVSKSKDDITKDTFTVLKNPLFLLLAIAMFFYAGSELSTTNWTGTFLENFYGISREEVPNILLSFWILFTVGRALGDKFLDKVGRLRLLAIAPLVDIAGIIVILIGRNRIQAYVGYAVIGISMALIYPALQGYIIQNVDKKYAPIASSIITIFNNMGAMILSYLIGFAAGIRITYVFFVQILFYVYISIISFRYLLFKTKKAAKR